MDQIHPFIRPLDLVPSRCFSFASFSLSIVSRENLYPELVKEMDELCEEKLPFFGLILGKGIVGYKVINKSLYILGVAGKNIATQFGAISLRKFCRILGVTKAICKAKTKSRQKLFEKMGFHGCQNEMIFEV
jgi:hypothetical protein